MEEEAESASLATEKTEGIHNTKYSHVLYAYKSLIATPQPSILFLQSFRTDSSLEQVPAIASELIDLVAAISLPVDVHKCMIKASLQLQCNPRGTAEPQVHNSRCSWPMNYNSSVRHDERPSLCRVQYTCWYARTATCSN